MHHTRVHAAARLQLHNPLGQRPDDTAICEPRLGYGITRRYSSTFPLPDAQARLFIILPRCFHRSTRDADITCLIVESNHASSASRTTICPVHRLSYFQLQNCFQMQNEDLVNHDYPINRGQLLPAIGSSSMRDRKY